MEGSDFDGAHRRAAGAPGPQGGHGGAARRELRRSRRAAAAAARPRRRDVGGWGDDGGGGERRGCPAPRRRAAEENSPPAVEQTRNRHFDDDDGSDGGLNLIPDLDDEEAEDVTRQVAVAPALKTSRVPTIEELDAEIDLALPSASEIGIDLTALPKFLAEGAGAGGGRAVDYEHEVGKLASEMQAEIDARADAVAAKAGSPKEVVGQ